jgi:hypothetical protein
VIAGHRGVDPRKKRIRASLQITDLSPGDMRREIVFFTAGRFTGMTTDAIVRGKMKTHLFLNRKHN